VEARVGLGISVGERLRGWRGQRKAVVAAWVAAFAVVGGGLAARGERLLLRLVETPRPQSMPASVPTVLPQQSAGHSALSAARELIDRGDAAGALVALGGVLPSEPAYPFARQLREEAEAALQAPRVRR
jgi:hypothetical protein